MLKSVTSKNFQKIAKMSYFNQTWQENIFFTKSGSSFLARIVVHLKVGEKYKCILINSRCCQTALNFSKQKFSITDSGQNYSVCIVHVTYVPIYPMNINMHVHFRWVDKPRRAPHSGQRGSNYAAAEAAVFFAGGKQSTKNVRLLSHRKNRVFNFSFLQKHGSALQTHIGSYELQSHQSHGSRWRHTAAAANWPDDQPVWCWRTNGGICSVTSLESKYGYNADLVVDDLCIIISK